MPHVLSFLLTLLLSLLAGIFIPATGRMLERTYMTYGTAAEDFRLKQISNKSADGTILSRHSYTFTKDAQILTWQREYGGAGAPAADDFTFSYDGADRLTGGALKNSGTGAVLADHKLIQDSADNRVSIREGNKLKSGVFNSVNQLTSEAGGGKARITGTINKPGTSVTVAGRPATVHPQGGFAVEVDAAPGANHFPLVVTEADGTVTTKHVDLTFDQGVPVIHTYDANGNLESIAPQSAPGSPTRTYQWDAADRLVGITRILSPTESRKTELLYNGVGDRVGKRELFNGVAESEIKYLYGGTGVLQERSADGGTVTKTYASQGEQSYLPFNSQPSTLNLLYTRDHLGSVREVWEVWDENSGLLARYDYKPYGERILVSGSHESAKGYTGHDYHSPTGLILTRYRAYDPGIGRWLSADPLGESGGMNLYGYVGNDPVNGLDPLGLDAEQANVTAAWWNAENARRGAIGGAAIGGLLAGGQRGIQDAATRKRLGDCGELDLAPALDPGGYGKDVAIGAVSGAVGGYAIGGVSGYVGGLLAKVKIGGSGVKGLPVPEGLPTTIFGPKQAIHTPGPTLLPGRSPMTGDAQALLDGVHAGKYPIIRLNPRGQPVVDFGEVIGIDTGSGNATQFGTIHFGQKGVHIVPANPIQY